MLITVPLLMDALCISGHMFMYNISCYRVQCNTLWLRSK